MEDAKTMKAIENSRKETAKVTSDEKVGELVQDFLDTSTDFYKMFVDNPDFKREYLGFIFEKIWSQANQNRAGK